MRKRHRVLTALFAVAVLVAVATLVSVRIWWVNVSAYQLPVEHYGMGEDIALEGSFLGQRIEDTEGYDVVVQGVQRMSFNDYLDRYGVEGTTYALSDYMIADGGMDGTDVVVVDLLVANPGGSDGYVAALNWRLVAQDVASPLLPNLDLLRTSEPSITGGYFAVAPAANHLLHVPFNLQAKGPYFAPGAEMHYREVPAGAYTFNVANYPVQKTVEFMLS